MIMSWGLPQGFFQVRKISENTAHHVDIKIIWNCVILFFSILHCSYLMPQCLCALTLQRKSLHSHIIKFIISSVQFNYCKDWKTTTGRFYPGHRCFPSLFPYSLLIYHSKNYLKYFPLLPGNSEHKQKNMSHKHRRNAWNYFGVCCRACLFRRHHLFNTRRAQLFITSAAMAQTYSKSRFVSCLAPVTPARCVSLFLHVRVLAFQRLS